MADERRTVVVDVEVDEGEGKDFQDLAGDIKLAGVSFNDLSASLKNARAGFASAIKSLKALRLAIIGTGIGALLVALGSLLTFLQKTQAGSDILTKRLGQLGAVVDVLIGRFAKLGESVFKVFQFDFEGAGKAIQEAFSGVTEEITEAVEAAGEFADAQVELEEATIAFTTRTAELRNEIAKRILITRDLTKTDEERRTALEEAAAFEQEQLQLQIELAQKRLEQAEADLRNDPENLRNREKELAVAQARAELTNLETDSLNRQREILNRQNELENQIRAQQSARNTEAEAERKQLLEGFTKGQKLEEDRTKKTEKLKRDEAKKTLDARIKALGETSAATIEFNEAEKARINERKEAQQLADQENIESAANLFGTVGEFSEEGSKFQKFVQAAQATINSFTAFTAALGSTPFTLANFALAAAALASGLNAVRKITAVNTGRAPAPKGASGGDIYDIGGRRHSQGGTMFWGADGTRVELEAGEKLFVLSRGASAAYDALAQFNSSFTSGFGDTRGGTFFQAGGEIPQSRISSEFIDTQIQLSQIIENLPNPVVSVRDISEVQNRVSVSDSRGVF